MQAGAVVPKVLQHKLVHAAGSPSSSPFSPISCCVSRSSCHLGHSSSCTRPPQQTGWFQVGPVRRRKLRLGTTPSHTWLTTPSVSAKLITYCAPSRTSQSRRGRYNGSGFPTRCTKPRSTDHAFERSSREGTPSCSPSFAFLSLQSCRLSA